MKGSSSEQRGTSARDKYDEGYFGGVFVGPVSSLSIRIMGSTGVPAHPLLADPGLVLLRYGNGATALREL